jgi:hypothetical protein
LLLLKQVDQTDNQNQNTSSSLSKPNSYAQLTVSVAGVGAAGKTDLNLTSTPHSVSM